MQKVPDKTGTHNITSDGHRLLSLRHRGAETILAPGVIVTVFPLEGHATAAGPPAWTPDGRQEEESLVRPTELQTSSPRVVFQPSTRLSPSDLSPQLVGPTLVDWLVQLAPGGDVGTAAGRGFPFASSSSSSSPFLFQVLEAKTRLETKH